MIKGFEDLREDKPSNVVRPSFWVTGQGYKPSGASISPTMIWWQHHNRLRQQRLENEIDLGDIKAALRGVINSWSERVKKHPDVFKPIAECRQYDWQAIINVE